MTGCSLHNPTFTLLHDKAVIIAHAYIATPDTNKAQHKRQQSACVRALLSKTLYKFNITAKLQDTHLPYRLIGGRHGFVSFSHSGNQVALIISPTPCAIDIEIHPVSPAIANRYYHPNELMLINQAIAKQSLIAALWRIKECWIKLYHGRLHAGLGVDFSAMTLPDASTQLQLVRTSVAAGHWVYHQPRLQLNAIFADDNVAFA